MRPIALAQSASAVRHQAVIVEAIAVKRLVDKAGRGSAMEKPDHALPIIDRPQRFVELSHLNQRRSPVTRCDAEAVRGGVLMRPLLPAP
jgi:hypothetical protein